MKTISTLAILPLLLAGRAQAITINFTDTTAPGNYPTFDPTGANLAAIVAACKTVWQDIIEDVGTVNITYSYASIAGLANGTATATSGGKPTAGHINVDSDNVRTWYFDPTPTNNSEYDFTQRLYQDLTGTQQANWFNNTPPLLIESSYRGVANATAPANAANGFDMYTTFLHEVGHVLGLSSSMASQEARDSGGVFGAGDFDFDVPSTFANGDPFAVRASGTNPDDVNDWAHVAAASFMCDSCAATGLRRLPAAADILAIAACSNWTSIDLPRQDFLPRQGIGTGSSTDFNNATNWEGNQVPSTADEAYLRLGTLVGGGAGIDIQLTAARGVGSLLVSNATDLFTNANLLDVVGTTTIEFDGNFPFPQIFVATSGELESGDLIVNGGELDMSGGLADIQNDLTLTADTLGREGAISGSGTVDVAGTLINNGRITGTDEVSPLLNFISAAASPWDLDGTSGNGEVYATAGNISFSSGSISDAFDGIFRVDDPHILTIAVGWTLGGGGQVDLNGGDPDFATLSGGLITASGGTIDASGLSRITAPITLSGSADMNCLGTVLLDRLELDGTTTITGGTIDISADSSLQIDGTTSISGGTFTTFAGSLLNLRGVTTLTGGSYNGPGEVQFEAPVTVNQPVTIDTDLFDMDGVTTGDDTLTLNDDLTINSNFIDDGNNSFNDLLAINGSGTTLHIPNVLSWFCTNQLNITTGTTATFPSITGAPFNFSGTATISGGTRWDAQSTLSGTVNFSSATSRLAFTTGDALTPHRLVGATINAPGTLRAVFTSHVIGSGTISADLDFLSGTKLLADNGTLTLSGAFTSISTLGTADTDGTLNVVPSWTLPTSSDLSLVGGIVTGGSINNGGNITGFGTITSTQLTNNGTISATDGQTLVINTTSNTDLDGTAPTAGHTVNAVDGNVRLSKPLSDAYDAAINVGAGREIEFVQGWTLNTAGVLNLVGGPSAVNPAVLRGLSHGLSGQINCSGETRLFGIATFNSGSNLSIPAASDVLRLFDNTNINFGTTVTGSGSLAVVTPSILVLPDDINIQPNLLLAGTLELANASGSQATVGDFSPTVNARLNIDIKATPAQAALNDRLTSLSPVNLFGNLLVRFTSAPPIVGQRWTILDAPAVSGTFANVTTTGVPAGYFLRVVYTATSVDAVIGKSETYNDWIVRNGLTNLDKLPGTDTDGDGMDNGVEYARGLDPNSFEPGEQPETGIIDVAGTDYLSLSARIHTLCESPDATLGVTRSIDLTTFGPANVILHSSVLDGPTQIRTDTWRSTVPFGSLPAEFLRLEAVISAGP